MKDETPRCPKCGATEDADVIEAVGLCAACAHREAVVSLSQELRRSYGLQDGNVDK
jgi:hypothetical protein